jgi:dUTP pyrophosphatase
MTLEENRLIDERFKSLEDQIKYLTQDAHFVRDVPFKKLHPDAVAPKYYSDGAAAFDLHPLITDGDVIEVPPNSQKIIKTGIAFSVPDGFELRISPRSGQSAKEQISIRNSPGIIDSDYIGEIMVIFVNNKDTTHIITKDQRVCQVKLSKAYHADFEEVDDLGTTKRGDGRFGSTGGD